MLGAAATLDWWLPPLGERFAGELSYAERETRVGRTVTWREVEWRGEGLVVRADEAEVSAPWRLIRRGRADARVRGWSVEMEASAGGGEEPAGGEFGWPELWAVLAEVGGHMEKRAGDVVLTDGVVRVAGEEIAVAEFSIKAGVLAGEVSWRGQAVRFEASLATGRLRVAHAESGAVIEARVGAEDVGGRVRWAGNEAAFAASEFAAGEWVPAEFVLEGVDWRLPVERLGVGAEGFYEDLRGDFSVRRAGDGVSVAVNAEAAPREEELPAVKVVIGGEASARRVRVEKLEVDSPSASARLSAPVEWSAEGGWSAPEAAEFSVAADLAGLSAGRVEGRVAGVARWSGQRVRWEASVAEGAWGELRAVAAKLAGESDLAATVIGTAEVRVGEATRMELSGRITHAEGGRVEKAKLAGKVDGAIFARWLPEGLSPGLVEVEAEADGAWADLDVMAEVTARDVAYAEWRADEVAVAVLGSVSTGWGGELAVTRGAAVLEAEGGYDGEAATLKSMRWRRDDGAELILDEAGEVSRERVKLALSGAGETRVAVDWVRAGEASIVVNAWESAWLEEWREGAAWPAVTVRELKVKGRLDAERFVEGEGELRVVWRRENEPELWMWFSGAADARGLSVTQLEAGQGAETLVSGLGRAPWRVRLGDEVELEPAESGEWSLRLDSRPEATVWEAVAKAAGVTLERPALSLALAGPAMKPNGRADFSAGRIGLSGEGLPEGGVDLRELRLETTVNAGEIMVPVLQAEVDGQRVEADGRLVLAEGDWARLRARPFVWLLRNADARLRLPEAQVSALARYLPRLLAPTGTVEAELRLSPGSRLDGRVVLRDGGTRPLGDFGVLHDIDLDLVLAGMEMRVERATARAGGQEVAITGGARRVPGKSPVLDLALRAERFPLVRKPGLILRGDLNLTVKTNEATERTRVGGSVVLRDSLVLADIRPLLAAGGGPASAARARPPYFSVDTPPLGDWELGVTVRGDRFVRVRTPVFEGRASAAFALEGTLREPRVSGELTVDPGRILFPFASFVVQEGAVRISRSDPYTARLDFRAAGRRLGYDLRLEIDGTAEAPQLRLFSTPALDAETLLLMVTAGVAPAEGQTAGAGQRLAAVGAYVGRDLLRTFGFAGTEEDRLTIRAGDQVSRAGRETYGFDFRLTDRWSLVGDYDEFDAYNMGVRMRFRAKVPEAENEERAAAEETP